MIKSATLISDTIRTNATDTDIDCGPVLLKGLATVGDGIALSRIRRASSSEIGSLIVFQSEIFKVWYHHEVLFPTIECLLWVRRLRDSTASIVTLIRWLKAFQKEWFNIFNKDFEGKLSCILFEFSEDKRLTVSVKSHYNLGISMWYCEINERDKNETSQ